MQVLVEIPEHVAAQAQKKGLAIEPYVQQALNRLAEADEEGSWTPLGGGPYTPEEAGRNIRELRKKNILGGLKIRDLIHEGHKY
jgi:hypothetical protein